MKLTDSALAQFKQVLKENENPASGVRFFTVKGCCSPLLQMEVSPLPKKGDVVLKIGEVDFFLTQEADKILTPLTIDFSDGSFHSAETDELSNK